MNEFIEQLKRTNSINQSQDKQIRENYKGIHLHTKVENKSVISRLINNIMWLNRIIFLNLKKSQV